MKPNFRVRIDRGIGEPFVRASQHLTPDAALVEALIFFAEMYDDAISDIPRIAIFKVNHDDIEEASA